MKKKQNKCSQIIWTAPVRTGEHICGTPVIRVAQVWWTGCWGGSRAGGECVRCRQNTGLFVRLVDGRQAASTCDPRSNNSQLARVISHPIPEEREKESINSLLQEYRLGAKVTLRSHSITPDPVIYVGCRNSTPSSLLPSLPLTSPRLSGLH